jgi:hypothetical protein
MPQSRKRPGHHYRKPSDIPSSQRTRGRVIWAILFAVFALIIGFFVAGNNVIVLILTTLIGAGIGYMVGMKAEKA